MQWRKQSCWVRCLQRHRGRQRCSQEMARLWRPKAGIYPLGSGSRVLQAHGSFSFSPSRQVTCFRERKEEILDVEVKKNEWRNPTCHKATNVNSGCSIESLGDLWKRPMFDPSSCLLIESQFLVGGVQVSWLWWAAQVENHCFRASWMHLSVSNTYYRAPWARDSDWMGLQFLINF